MEFAAVRIGGDEEDSALVGGHPHVVARRDLQRCQPVVEALEVEGHGDRLVLVFLAVLARVAVRLVHFVAARPVQGRAVGGQRGGEDPRGVVVEIIELVGRKLEVPVTRGGEVKIAALRIEHRVLLVGVVESELPGLAVARRVDPDRAVVALVDLGVGEPLAVRRPGVLRQVAERTVGVAGGVHLADAAAVDIHDVEAVGAVGKGQLFRIGRPLGRKAPRVAVTGHLARLAAAVLGADVDLVLAGGVRQVGNPLAVRGPGDADFARCRRAREIADLAVLGRRGEDFAAGAEHRALAGGRNVEALDLGLDVLEGRQRMRPVAAHLDGNTTGLALGRVMQPDVAAILEHDALAVRAGPQDVEILEIRDLADIGAVHRHDEQVERVFPVGGPVDAAVHPQRLVVGADEVGQLARGVVREVIGPHVLRAAAPVPFPGAELAVDRRVDVGLAVAGQHSPAGFRRPQPPGHAALERHQQGHAHALSVRRAVGAHQHVLAVGRPVQHAVVRPAARRHRAHVGVEGQLARLAPGRGHHPDLARSGVLGGVGEPAPVRRKLRVKLLALVGSQALRDPARRKRGVDIPAVDEGDLVAVDVGEAQQPGVLGHERGRAEQRKHQEQQRSHA